MQQDERESTPVPDAVEKEPTVPSQGDEEKKPENPEVKTDLD